MHPPKFAHLHLHSEYSLLDGGNRIDRLVHRVAELGMDAVALTDHGNLHGALEFYRAAKKKGIKPILGIEAYVATGDRTDRTPGTPGSGMSNTTNHHLVLLAENQTGWRNLLKLSSDSFRNGFYYKPRMDRSTLTQWSSGLIAINGHLGSSIAHHLVQYVQRGNDADYQRAVEEARWHADTFGVNERGEPCFYVELQRHDVLEQQQINPHLIRLAHELDLPLVCDNDVHYLTREDHDNHDTLCCISMGKLKDDTNRLHYSRDLYLKSPQEMAELFDDCTEAVENAVAIAERCDVQLDLEASHTPMVRIIHPGQPPHYDGGEPTEWFKSYCSGFQLVPFDATQDDATPERVREECDQALRDLCEAGLVWRYGAKGVTDSIRQRLDRELRILSDKLISAYFLIVWDFVNWARQRGIPANARGSGVGTMVGYVLGLSNACPERYGLLFERFTDPDRSEYPDIDIDICQDGRAHVINYVREKYGHVAQIITFGRLKARAAIKDVARVMGLAPAEGQRLANLVPAELNIRLDAALEKEPELKGQYETDAVVRKVVDGARALEDHARHAGVHAAGVVIATEPLDNIVPLCRASGSEDVVTQWDGPTCEQVGLLKMDFLGLRTLSTIERAKRLIGETLPEAATWSAVGRTLGDGVHPLDLDRLTYDDPKVLACFSRGDTSGVFQFESGGMRKLLMQMKPDRLEDLIAANALFRPGPMDLIPDYCQRKHREQAVPVMHPIVEQYTSETYGIMVYQEQVMQIVHGLGDIPLRDAYTLIKAISKKKHDVIDAVRPKFIEGAKAKGLGAGQANDLFDLILKFAGYGFNKSHSTGYAIIAYQTAYLKTYFPNQYMAALLTFESAAKKIDDWAPYLEDCRLTVFPDSTDEEPHVGVVIRPPDINRSDRDFTVVFDDDEAQDAVHGHVRFGLGAIKGVGRSAIEAIIEERQENGRYASIFDVCERLSSRVVTKATLEALTKSGAFDSVHGLAQRAAVTEAIESALSAGQAAAEDRRTGQMSIFGAPDPEAAPEDAPSPVPAPVLPNVTPWDRMQTLESEKQVLGFHVSGHPLEDHQGTIETLCTADTASIAHRVQDAKVVIAGILTRVRLTVTRRGKSAGQRMAIITLQDKLGSIDGVVFSSVYARCSPQLLDGAIVIIVASVDRSQGDVQLIVDNVYAIDRAATQLAGEIRIDLGDADGADPLQDRMNLVAGLLEQANATRTVEDGRPAEVLIQLNANGKRVAMRSNRLRAVATAPLVERLCEVVGADHVQLRRATEVDRPEPRRR